MNNTYSELAGITALALSSYALNSLFAIALTLILCSSKNMRQLAAWLITKATAKDELEAAARGIEIERRREQEIWKMRLIGVERPDARLDAHMAHTQTDPDRELYKD